MNELKEQEQSETIEETAPVVPVAPKSAKKRRSGMWGLVLLLVVIVVFGTLQVLGLLPTSTLGDQAVNDSSAMVASVNGIVVTRGELDQRMDQVRNSIPAGAVDPTTDAGFELQLLDELINLKLLHAKAEAMGITVTDDQVTQELQTLIDASGGEEVFQQQLEKTGISRDELVDNMRTDFMIRQLLTRETDLDTVTVTDEELAAAYEQAVAAAGDSGEVPPYDQIEELIRNQLTQQKSAAIVKEYIDSLRADADIQITV